MDIIELLIGLVVVIVVLALLWAALEKALSLTPLDPTWRTVLQIVLLLVLVVILWDLFGGYVHLP